MATKRKAGPTKAAIAQYWSANEKLLNVVWEQPGCFACGLDWSAGASLAKRWNSSMLQVAHLIPHAFGGPTDAGNLVLLCARCHREAPMVGISAEPMLKWINQREPYINYALRRITEECELISPGLLERVPYSVWNGQGESLGECILDFTAKWRIIQNFLTLGVHPGGEMFASVAVVLSSMDKLDLPSLSGRGTNDD